MHVWPISLLLTLNVSTLCAFVSAGVLDSFCQPRDGHWILCDVWELLQTVLPGSAAHRVLPSVRTY